MKQAVRRDFQGTPLSNTSTRLCSERLQQRVLIAKPSELDNSGFGYPAHTRW